MYVIYFEKISQVLMVAWHSLVCLISGGATDWKANVTCGGNTKSFVSSFVYNRGFLWRWALVSCNSVFVHVWEVSEVWFWLIEAMSPFLGTGKSANSFRAQWPVCIRTDQEVIVRKKSCGNQNTKILTVLGDFCERWASCSSAAMGLICFCHWTTTICC